MMKIRLLHPHRHANQDLKPGDVIAVLPMIGDWLVSHSVGEWVDNKPSIKKTSNAALQKEAVQSEDTGEA